LPACGSILLLSITNHITQNVAAVPLLWVLPLALYLLTFMLSFARRPLYRRRIWLRVLAMSLGLLGYAIYDIQVVEAVQISLPIFLFGLFAGCFFCHGELSALRPPPERLTEFYLFIAAGGAAGAIFVGLITPHIFNGIYELPLSLVMTAAVAAVVIWKDDSWPSRLFWAGITATMGAVFVSDVRGFRENSLLLERSFYGSLRVVQTPIISENQTRTLFHGTIKHGEEFLWPARRKRPTTYYGPDSGIGILLRECYPGPKNVGIVGLGAGTIAAYAQSGDNYRFYEINQQVVNIAQGLFYFLRQPGAHIDIAVGDGRLALQRETGASFDVLALDAFSGDAIPVHLLTEEAFQLYRRRLRDGGTLAFHVSNQYLDLAVIVRQLAELNGFRAVLVRNHQDVEALVDAADWVLITNNRTVLENPSVRTHAIPIASRAGMRPWTDSYNNLLEVFKKPQIEH
jgi:SAM-dependent methyltransferase